jgi:hypothetical protein
MMGQGGWAALLAFDIRLDFWDNNERLGCHPSGHEGDLAKALPLPLATLISGVVFMQRAITLLIVETKQMHHWPGAPARVASTSSPGVARRGPLCLQPCRPRCDPSKLEPTGRSSGSYLDSISDYKGRTD